MKKLIQSYKVFIKRQSLVLTFLALSTLIPSISQASSVYGAVEFVLPHAGEQVFFNIKNHVRSGCITTDAGRFRIDLTTKTGSAMYSLLLIAQVQGKPVSVVGSGACEQSRENVNYITLY